MSRMSLVGITIVAFALGIGGGYLWQHFHAKPALALERATVLADAGRRLPDFHLQGADGQVFDRAQLKGRWTLMFFGYTHCPDICPLTLAELASFYRELTSTYQADTRVVFVSVDPKRDSGKILGDYVRHFSANFSAATGTDTELKTLTGALGVAYSYTGDGDNYEVSHTASVFLIDPRERLYAVFSPPLSAAVVAKDYTAIRENAS